MRIALIGFGSVGRALAHLLEARRDELYRQFGLSPRLVLVADSRGYAADPDGLSADRLVATKTATGSVLGAGHSGGPLPHAGPGSDLLPRIIRDAPADVVVEASPSVLSNPGPGFENLRSAMVSGKHAVSVNKAPLAAAMPALLELARFNNVQLRYSGTVGAGTPVLATARLLAQSDTIESIRGILNGTTNFILWRMLDGSDTYAGALAEAIRLGYAETDPSADVDGIDTQAKVTILANAVLGLGITVDQVSVTGIRDIERARVERAAREGLSIKLIGEIDARTRRVSVSPQPVPRGGPLDVPANLNAVQIVTRSAGEVTLVGRGAGGPETATAIVRDLVDIWNVVPH